jgi:hypothetical protein
MCREKNGSRDFFLPSRVESQFKINTDMTGELCIKQASHQETCYLKKFKKLRTLYSNYLTLQETNMRRITTQQFMNGKRRKKKQK